MAEDPFVTRAFRAAQQVLKPPLQIRRGAALLYQMTVDSKLQVNVDARAPSRGQSAFQTDLCVFEEVSKEVFVPRVVMEFKSGVSTHDVLTYSAKARKHKHIYPYLRYGLVVRKERLVPNRFSSTTRTSISV